VALVWLSIRLRWRRAWARSLAVVLLIGGVGGFILAAAASARRVQATYQTFIEEIDAPDAIVVPGCAGPVTAFGCTVPAEQVSGETMIEDLEEVELVEAARLVTSVMPYLVDSDGRPLLSTPDDRYGCVDGDHAVHLLPLTPGDAKAQAMPFQLDGALPKSGTSEVVVALATAKRKGIDVGDTVRVAGWCDGDGEPVRLDRAIDLTVTGISVSPLGIEPPGTGRVIEVAYSDSGVVDRLIAAGAEPQENAIVWLDDGSSSDSVSQAIAPYRIERDLRERAVVFDDALATDARPLWLLAGVGVLGGMLLLAPIVGRQVRDTTRDSTTLVVLGSTRRQVATQALTHAGVLAVLGGLVAAAIAPLMSTLLPRGFAVTIAPHLPVRFDWLVTVIGVVLLVASVVAIGGAASWMIGRRREPPVEHLSGHRRMVAGAAHLRPAARTGVLTALGAPAGPRQAKPWPSFISLAVAAATCVACLTYLAGLKHLERTPALLGWDWDATVAFDHDTPAYVPSILARLNAMEGVEQVTLGTVYPPTFLQIAGTDTVVWPWSFDTGPDAIAPAITNGRAPEGPREVAINPALARAAGLDIGDTVSLARPSLISLVADNVELGAVERGLTDLALDRPDLQPVSIDYEITGIAVLPLGRTEDYAQTAMTLEGFAALAEPSKQEVAEAVAWLPPGLPEDLRAEVDPSRSDFEIDNKSVYVRFSGDTQSTATAIWRIAGVRGVAAPSPEQVLTTVLGLNLDHNDQVPVALVYVVSIAAAALLIYLLHTSVRARRFEFAVMRAVGMSSRGVRWSIAAQATAMAIIPLVVAIPVGVVAGRRVWMSSARDLDVVPVSVTPWFAVTVVVAAAIAIANAVVLVPGWTAVRRSPGRDLRAG
jgi:FtsX-like permease family